MKRINQIRHELRNLNARYENYELGNGMNLRVCRYHCSLWRPGWNTKHVARFRRVEIFSVVFYFYSKRKRRLQWKLWHPREVKWSRNWDTSAIQEIYWYKIQRIKYKTRITLKIIKTISFCYLLRQKINKGNIIPNFGSEPKFICPMETIIRYCKALWEFSWLLKSESWALMQTNIFYTS